MIGGCGLMIISNEKKFIYLRVPKTGSTSVSVFLYENLPLESSIIRSSDTGRIFTTEESCKIANGYFVDNSLTIHSTLDDIVKSGLLIHPVHEYSVYAVCRNPIDRFLSFQNMMIHTDGVNFLDNYSIFKEYMAIFEAKPQTTWLRYNGKLLDNIFLYDDLPRLVSSIAARYNIIDISNFYNYDFRNYRKTVKTVDDKALEYIQSYWQDDFKIYNTLRSKKANS